MLIVNKHCAIFTTSIRRTPSINIIISGQLGRSRRCPLNRGFTLLRSGFVNEDLTLAVVIAI